MNRSRLWVFIFTLVLLTAASVDEVDGGDVIQFRGLASDEPEFVRLIRQTRRLEFVTSVPLQAGTFHPQGLKIIGRELYLTSVEGHVTGAGHLFHFSLDSIPAPARARFIESRQFAAGRGGLMNHAGGMDLSGDDLIIPLAAYNWYGPAKILRVPLRDFGRGGGVVASIGDHLGAMMILGGHKAFAFNWNAKSAHAIDLRSGRDLGLIDGDGWAYQDCKRVGDRWALCTATSSGFFRESGAIRLITIDERERRIRTVWSIRAPRVEADGRTGSGVFLSRNPLDFKVMRNANGTTSLYFYFVPHDAPDSRLLVYRAGP